MQKQIIGSSLNSFEISSSQTSGTTSLASLSMNLQDVQKVVNTSFTENLINSTGVDLAFNNSVALPVNNLTNITPPSFGVIGHLDPTRSLLVDSLANIFKLRGDLLQFDNSGALVAESLIARVKKLFDDVNAAYASELNSVPANDWVARFDKRSKNIAEFDTGDAAAPKITLGTIKDLGDKIDSVTDATKKSTYYASALFASGQSFRSDIRDLDNLHGTLLELQTKLTRLQTIKNNQLIKLNVDIPDAQRELANANQERLKTLADYQVAKNLVQENWAAVEIAYNRRENILTHHHGIYYARVSETPYPMQALMDLPLEYGRLEDLVPSIPLDHKELPEDIEPFIQAVVDIPISNWNVFNNQWDLLPNRATLLKILAQRKIRMDYVSKTIPNTSSNQFKQLLQSHSAILNDYARFTFYSEQSLQAFNRQAAQVISVEDLLAGTPHQLRGKVQEFRNRIDQATHALLNYLKNIRPSLRLDWAKSAELDELDLQNPPSWKGLEAAQTDDLEGIRNFIAVIHWWWRQLNSDATSSSVTAIRNLLRAVLLVAAGDDPDEIIHGHLQVVPGSFRLGDFLRVNLNRHAPIGTVLQLMDDQDKLIGKLRVEDADDKGSVVSVINVFHADVKSASSQYSVVGMKNVARSMA